jgi:hypothetical protein
MEIKHTSDETITQTDLSSYFICGNILNVKQFFMPESRWLHIICKNKAPMMHKTWIKNNIKINFYY